MSDDISDEEKRTLWVGGIDSRVDEELLYELMLNAGPIVSVTIPKDKQTMRSKPFAFVLYEYEESLPYAVELFKDTKLFGGSLKLQNRATGLGISTYANHNGNSRTEKSISQNEYRSDQINRSPRPSHVPLQQNGSPVIEVRQTREVDIQSPYDLNQWSYSGDNDSPNHLMSLYMSLLSSPNPLYSSQNSSPNPLFSPHQQNSPNLMVSPNERRSPHDDYNNHINNVMQENRTNIYERRRRSNQGYQDNSSQNRNEGRYGRSPINYHRREDRSRSNDRHRSREQRHHRRY